MSVLNQSGEEQVECPLCMEPLEVDDLNFFPCTCGYQICRFCWHRIRTDENGLCPACRKAYPENPADFKPLSQEEVAKLKAEKRHKDQQRKQRITENRKHLANVRVVQRNLVFVVGLPMRLADSEVLKKHEYFGKFGKIHKVVINQSTSYAGSQGPSASAYVTYNRADDALRAIQAVNNIVVDGRTVKASLGTTKYCSHFMKNQTCPKPDCMYLHELGDPEASFTKEEMQQAKHQEYEKKLHEQLLNSYNQANKDRKPTPSPPAVALMNCQTISSSSNCTGAMPTPLHTSQSCNKEAWPSLQPGVPTSGTNSTGTSSSSCSSNSSSSNSSISIAPSSNNSCTSNAHHISTKGESNQRRQKFDHMSSTKGSNSSYKKRHNNSEEHRGKSKEKLHCTILEDHQHKAIHGKISVSNSQRLNTKSPKELASNDVQKLSILARHQNHQTALSDLSVENTLTEIAGIGINTEETETENDLICVGGNLTSENVTGRSVTSGGRVLPTSHRAATLFEPDNNSFFSTNNFTKVAASAAGSAGPEWPLSGLTLTHMPDVLPPVHSSEDWQAAFGFTNSANVASLQQGHSPNQAAPDTSPTSAAGFNATSKDSDNCDQVSYEFRNGQQIPVQGFMGRNSHSTSVESVNSSIVQTSPEEFRVSDVGHINQKLGSFSLDDMPPIASVPITGSGISGNGTLPLHPDTCNEPPAAVSPNSSHVYPSNHPSQYVQEQPVFMVNRHHYLPPPAPSNMPHLLHNGGPPPPPAKFIAEFHIRQPNPVQNLQPQQQQHIPMQIHTETIVESTNYNRHLVDGSVNNTFIGSGDCGSVMTTVKNVRNITKLPNGTDVDIADRDDTYQVSEDNGYSNYGTLERQKCGGDNSSDDYLEFDRDSEIGEQDDNEEVSGKENTRLTDDDLGFDPFHETQKALAEMMEKENMMLMLQGQQNHVSHPNQHVNHLHQQYQHLPSHPAHFNYAAQPSVFLGNKMLPGYSASQHSLLQQNNHRLQHNLSGCNKLVEGLGPVPPRTRLPPPGFTTAPNHMNAFGLGIPRAPTNTGSKILPFMGLPSGSSPSNNGTASPIPQALNGIPNNIPHTPALNSQPNVNPSPMLFSHTSPHGNTPNHLGNSYSLQNGIITTPPLVKPGADGFSVKEWPENLRSLLPNLGDASGSRQSPVTVTFSGSNTPTPPPPPGSQNTTFSPPTHQAMQTNNQKSWSGVGPCSDWTALDPAIMSSSRPHNYLASTSTVAQAQHPVILHNANSHVSHQAVNSQYLHIHTAQWLRTLNGENCLLYGANGQNVANSEWGMQNHHSPNSIAPPPPGFTLRMTSTQPTTIQSKSAVSMPQEIATKIGNA